VGGKKKREHETFSPFLSLSDLSLSFFSSFSFSLEPELGAPPVAALGVVPDLVPGAEADPLRDRPVLLRDVRELLLDDGGLVGRLESFFC
jgi:hypothetical protein